MRKNWSCRNIPNGWNLGTRLPKLNNVYESLGDGYWEDVEIKPSA